MPRRRWTSAGSAPRAWERAASLYQEATPDESRKMILTGLMEESKLGACRAQELTYSM